eukprot:7199711-Prymnesium_polylepis.1
MKDQIPNNRPPLLAITCCFAATSITTPSPLLSPSSCRGAAVAPALLASASPCRRLSPGVWNVWPRLAAFGWRLAGVCTGRLAVWPSRARLVHVWARLERLGLYHVRTTSGRGSKRPVER